MNKYILGSILFVLACLTGCDDSNDPFEGTDNFITSFTLKQGDQSLVASFRGDTIGVQRERYNQAGPRYSV